VLRIVSPCNCGRPKTKLRNWSRPLRVQQARADRAEEWLNRISKQIEHWVSAQSAAITQPTPTTQHGLDMSSTPSLHSGIEIYAKRRPKVVVKASTTSPAEATSIGNV
jgi:hypothetical protein